VDRFADDNKIPVVRFGKDDRKIDRMRRIWRRSPHRSGGVAAIGVAQEFAPVFLAVKKAPGRRCGSRSPRPIGGSPVITFTLDEDFGPAFVKVCAYFRIR